MSTNRRDFLNNMSLGVIGSAMLAFPAQALAFGRRRRSCEPCVPAGEAHTRKMKMQFVVGPFTFSFPLTDGGAASSPVPIYGAGAFCVWGGYSTGDVDSITDFELVDTSTTPSETVRRSVSGGGIVSNVMAMGRFAFFIPPVLGGGSADLTANIFRLRFRYMKGGVAKTPEITPGFYRCSTSMDPP